MFQKNAPSDEVIIITDSIPGEREVSQSLALPLSFNQPEGAVFSWTGWILVKDFTKGYGSRRRILSKGDTPGIYLDSTSNSLIFSVKTYGTTETILVSDIPAMKWVHFGMVVDQHAVDIYINGILKQHHTLTQLPDQNEQPIVMGPGWDGVLGRVTYYSKAIGFEKIQALSKEKPPNDMSRPVSNPDYFDITWYIGRLYSK